MSRWKLTFAAVSCWLGLLGCDPDDACDPGYYADHGYCLRDAGRDPFVADASADDGGALPSNPNAQFGTPCTRQSDCGGVAPVCGGPQLPICTMIQCLDSGEDVCPPPWMCVDVTKYNPGSGITHVCVKL